jgi:hypothetical protein
MTIYDALRKDLYLIPIINKAKDLYYQNDEPTTFTQHTSEGSIFNIKESALEAIPARSIACFFAKINIASMFDIYEIPMTNIFTAYRTILNLVDVPEVYGVLAVSPTIKFNPLHFLSPTMSSITKLVVYTAKEPQVIDQTILAEELTHIATVDTVLSQHNYLHRELTLGSFKISGNDNSNTWASFPNIYTSDTSSVILPAGETAEHCIVPHFFVSRGIIAPFYGFSRVNITKKEGESLSAMRSANISTNGSVCIGSLPSTKYDSYRCLNYSNLDSPYRADIMPKAYMSIAEAHKQYAKIKIQGILNESLGL